MYPLVKNIINEDYILKVFNNIKKDFKLTIIYNKEPIRHYKGDFKDSYITYISNINYKMDVITDFFIEDIRIECKNIKFNYSSREFYFKNKNKIKKNVLRMIKKKKIKHNEKLKIYYIYKYVINKLLIRDCDTFPLFVALSIYYTFKPQNVLDMSSGWGDRLISSIIYNNCNYQGIDPNSKLTDKYTNIINTLAKNSKNNYNIITDGFENVILKQQYDMMFSSPPYFNIEHYSSDNTQSYKKYSNLNKWLKNFMYVSIDKIWFHLINGGFLILVINDIKINNTLYSYTNSILKYILNKQNVKFINMLKYKTKLTIQPIWCFQKVNPIYNNIIDKPFFIKPVLYNNKKFNIIREDYLIGGSKQRIILDIIDTIKEKNLFYRGPVNGYAQIALAYGCFIKNKKCHLILNKQYNNKHYIITKIAKIFNAIIYEIPKPQNKEKEKEDIQKILNNYTDNYIFTLGFYNPLAIKTYKKSLEKLKEIVYPKRLWITASSGTIVDSLLEIFPKTIFNVIFIGDIRKDYYNHPKINVYRSKLPFRTKTKIIPPYTTELSYDGKIWEFVIKYGKNDDYVFNVAGIP